MDIVSFENEDGLLIFDNDQIVNELEKFYIKKFSDQDTKKIYVDKELVKKALEQISPEDFFDALQEVSPKGLS